MACGQGSRRRRPGRAGARRLGASTQHDLRFKRAASACGSRLGAVTTLGPSSRGPRLPMHAVAAPECPLIEASAALTAPPTAYRPEDEYVAAYCKRVGLENIPDWTFLVAFSFFRSIAIHQGASTSCSGSTATPRTRSSAPAESARIHAVCSGTRSPGKGSKPRCLASFLRPRCVLRGEREAVLPAVTAHGKRRPDLAAGVLDLAVAPGEVAEWSIAPHSKCGVRASVPGVRIPPSPPASRLTY